MAFDNQHLGVLLTSHPRAQMFMRQGIMSMLGFPGYVLLGYDDVDSKCLPLNQIVPPVDEILCTGKQFPPGSGHIRGELLQMRDGGQRLLDLGYKFIFKSGADSTAYIHAGFGRLYDRMRKIGVRLVCNGTALVFGETEAFVEAFSGYEKTKNCGAAELFFRRNMRRKGIAHEFDFDRKLWAAWLGRVHAQGRFCQSAGICIEHSWKIGELWPRDGKPMTPEERESAIEEMRQEWAKKKAEHRQRKRERAKAKAQGQA